MSVKVQVVFYSLYGHIYRMAEAVAEGARQVSGAQVELLQVAETLPADVISGFITFPQALPATGSTTIGPIDDAFWVAPITVTRLPDGSRPVGRTSTTRPGAWAELAFETTWALRPC